MAIYVYKNEVSGKTYEVEQSMKEDNYKYIVENDNGVKGYFSVEDLPVTDPDKYKVSKIILPTTFILTGGGPGFYHNDYHRKEKPWDR